MLNMQMRDYLFKYALNASQKSEHWIKTGSEFFINFVDILLNTVLGNTVLLLITDYKLPCINVISSVTVLK